jgi:cytochrome c2
MKRAILTTSLLSTICFQAVAEESEAEKQGDPGLVLSISVGDQKDTLVTKRAALSVAEGESPSAMLPAGKFTATWEGNLKLEKRERVYFSFEGNGSAELWVEGESVLKEEKLGEGETERLRLNSGMVPVKVTYTSPDNGAGHFRLNWRGREFAVEPVPAAVLFHEQSEDVKKAELVRRGRTLFAELKCSQCHDGGEGMPEASEMAPSLAGVGSRLDAGWMEAWLKDPKALRSHARMPQVLENADDAKHVAAYLEGLKAEEPVKIVGDKDAGGKLFHDLGCITCHKSERGQDEAQWAQAPIDLYNAGHKYEEGALVAFLKNPSAHHASTRMPDFGLEDKEAADLAAFVRGLATTEAPSFSNGDAAKGKEIAEKANCAQCHDGIEKSDATFAPLADLAAKVNSDKSCVGTGGSVDYGLPAEDAAALNAFMADVQASKSLAYFNKAEYAQRQFVNLNCASCHKHDGIDAGLAKVHPLTAKYTGKPYDAGGKGAAPPDVTFIGEKLRQDWMKELFSGTLENRSRPWQKQRMPAFPSRADNLAEGFAAAHGVIAETEKTEPVEEPGKTLFGMVGGFGCAACHGAGDVEPLAVFEAPGVNLLLAGERLRKDYYHRWMRDPRRIDPATIMPKYYVDENETTLSEPLEGDGYKQMEAIWQWMKELDK